MNISKPERTISNLFSLLTPGVALILVTGIVTDPVNYPKLLLLGGLGVSSLLLCVTYWRKEIWNESKLPLILVLFFVISAFNALVNSEQPVSQNLYGVFGRASGFLTYAFLSFSLIGATRIRHNQLRARILYGFFIVGLLNIAYCLWVILIGDFVGWTNPYGAILGLLGNPDFISAFLGMYIVGISSYVLHRQSRRFFRLLALTSIPIALFEILKSRAIQGLAVTVGGLGLLVFYRLYTSKLRKFSWGYLFVFSAGVFLAILGTLQKGPLDFIYKRSVSLRGSYWQAGIEMGLQNPLSGVGMDSYGEWYRKSRPPQALLDLPGPETGSNAAHNVFIDLFAFGGFPLIISYVAIVLLAISFIVKRILGSTTYDPIFITISLIWICYLAQSIISINQIGLAIWGWVLPGLILSYKKISPEVDLSTIQRGKQKSIKSPLILEPSTIAWIGLGIGVFLASPPFNADMKWFSAYQARDAAKLEEAITPKFLNPVDGFRYTQTVQLFAQSELYDLAKKHAVRALDANPNYFDLWRQFYFLPNISNEEKSLALENMKRLDPNNPNVTGE